MSGLKYEWVYCTARQRTLHLSIIHQLTWQGIIQGTQTSLRGKERTPYTRKPRRNHRETSPSQGSSSLYTMFFLCHFIRRMYILTLLDSHYFTCGFMCSQTSVLQPWHSAHGIDPPSDPKSIALFSSSSIPSFLILSHSFSLSFSSVTYIEIFLSDLTPSSSIYHLQASVFPHFSSLHPRLEYSLLMGRMSWGMTGRILSPPRARRSLIPALLKKS